MMATEKQIAANRANGAKGGPKTQEGKDRCKMNALKHGLACKTAVVMQGEDLEEFKLIYDEFFSSFRPVNGAERRLVRRLANADWKGNRKEYIETGLLDWHVVKERHAIEQDCKALNKPMPQGTEPARFVGLSFDKKDPNMDRFLRYAGAIDREFHRTLAELIGLVKFRDRMTVEDPQDDSVGDETSPLTVTVAPVFAPSAAGSASDPQPAAVAAQPGSSEPVATPIGSVPSPQVNSSIEALPASQPGLPAPGSGLTAGIGSVQSYSTDASESHISAPACRSDQLRSSEPPGPVNVAHSFDPAVAPATPENHV